MVAVIRIMLSECGAECIAEITAISLIWIVGFLLNIAALLVFYRKGSLRTSGHRFLMSITCSNVFIILFVIPNNFYGIIAGSPVINSFVCELSAFSVLYALGVTMLNVLLIGWDRFLACVGNPLHHRQRMSYEKSVFFITLSWLLPATFVAPVFIGGGYSHFDREKGICSVKWAATDLTKVTAVVCSIGAFVVPFFALIAIYVKVFISASNTTSTARKNFVYEFSNHLGIRRSITIELAKSRNEPRQTPSRQSSYSSLQAFLNGQDNRKTAQIVVWIILSGLICTFPFYSTMLVEAFFEEDVSQFSASFHRAVLFLFYLAATVFHPLIYVYSNSSLRRDVRRLFMKRAEIRRQCSLQIHGSFRSHSLLQVQRVDSDRCFSRNSFDVGALASGGVSSELPVITCNPAESDPPADCDQNDSAGDSGLLMPDAGVAMGKSGSSRSLSRKSVSFAEEDNPYSRKSSA